MKGSEIVPPKQPDNIKFSLFSLDDPEKVKSFLSQMNITFGSNNKIKLGSDSELTSITESEPELESESEIDHINSDDFDDVSEKISNIIFKQFTELDLQSDDLSESHLSEDKSDLICLDSNSNSNQSKSETDIIQVNQKITLNVGGKKFRVNKNLLNYLHIDCDTLYHDNTIYFLDRDSHYFSKIIEIIKKNGLEMTSILNDISTYSEQLLGELCYYHLIDAQYVREPKLKLNPNKSKSISGSDTIIKIIIKTKSFETCASTLTQSNYFEKKIKSKDTKIIHVTDIDIDPTIFRYVLNLLRQKELYITNSLIEDALNKFEIGYNRIENKHENIVICHPHKSTSESPSPNINSLRELNNIRKLFNSDHMSLENWDTIATDSELKFDADIVFDLFQGNNIKDILVCIDIPVLKSTDEVEYVDMFEYKLIEHANIIIHTASASGGKSTHSVLNSVTGNYLYLHPIIYKSNKSEWHQITRTNQKTKIIYQDNLIEIIRVVLPLFMFESKRNCLPIQKIIKNNKLVHLIIKMAPQHKILTQKNHNNIFKTHPLLNISLMINYSINTNPDPADYFIYDKLCIATVPIQQTDNKFYNMAIIPLNRFGIIKDFFFTICRTDDHLASTITIDKFSDDFIEMEIFELVPSETEPSGTILYMRLDAMIMNSYTPLKKLGHILPSGIYYHSFSPNPLKNKISGGLSGRNYVMRLKLKKIEGVIKFYLNEYYKIVL